VSECHRKLEALQTERDVAKGQAKLLTAYGRTLCSEHININDLERFLDMFSPRQLAIAQRIQELDLQVARADKEYNVARAQVFDDARGAKRGTKIMVTVLAEIDGEAELLLTYGMSEASEHGPASYI
jgi:hypothetical protein